MGPLCDQSVGIESGPGGVLVWHRVRGPPSRLGPWIAIHRIHLESGVRVAELYAARPHIIDDGNGPGEWGRAPGGMSGGCPATAQSPAGPAHVPWGARVERCQACMWPSLSIEPPRPHILPSGSSGDGCKPAVSGREGAAAGVLRCASGRGERHPRPSLQSSERALEAIEHPSLAAHISVHRKRGKLDLLLHNPALGVKRRQGKARIERQ
mgnify:CR=1 FL=1